MTDSNHDPDRSAARQGVLLDLDGTLVDSVYVHVKIWADTFRVHGFDVPHAAIHAAIGLGSDRLIPHLVGHDAPADELASGHAESFLAVADELRATNGALTLLEDLEQRGVPFAIATSAGADEREALLEVLGRTDLPVVDSSEVERSKPAPDLFLAAAEHVGLPAGQLTVVGDAPWDARAARAAGMRAIAVATGGFGVEVLTRSGAERVVDDPGELVGVL